MHRNRASFGRWLADRMPASDPDKPLIHVNAASDC